MLPDSDVALVGTGVAPLLAASYLLGHGKRPIVINPDWDFFLEGSELPLDPILDPAQLNAERLAACTPTRTIELLRPDFPGAVEIWHAESGMGPVEGYHDYEAPHVRSRGWLWLYEDEASWRREGEPFVEQVRSAGFHPQMMDGLRALTRFPGCARQMDMSMRDSVHGVFVPKLADVDVIQYHVGLLEYVSERLDPGCLWREASQIELTPDGIRFHSGTRVRLARLTQGVVVFWTPRLHALAAAWLSERASAAYADRGPASVRSWEEWSIASRDPIDPGMVGVFKKNWVWSELRPSAGGVGARSHELSVLRPGDQLELVAGVLERPVLNSISEGSFEELSSLFHGLLRWDHFSICQVRPHQVLDWHDLNPIPLSHGKLESCLVPGSDGFLARVVGQARAVASRYA